MGQEGAPEGPRIPGTKLLLASVSPYCRKLLLGSGGQIPGQKGDVIYVGVAGASEALALLVEVRRRPRACSPADLLLLPPGSVPALRGILRGREAW